VPGDEAQLQWLQDEIDRLTANDIKVRTEFIKQLDERDLFLSRAVLLLLKHIVVMDANEPDAQQAQAMVQMIYQEYPDWLARDQANQATYQQRARMHRFLGTQN
jgi:hypothetical protein